jgi:uncharacterized membrane protein YciS (DUF1049 family)
MLRITLIIFVMGIKLGIRTTVALTHNYLIDDINLRQYTITIIILFTVGINYA